MRMHRHVLLVFLAVLFAVAQWPGLGGVRPGRAGTMRLAGQLLVAAPGLADPRFRKSVIYMVDHDATGSLGLIVNKQFGRGQLADLLKGFGMNAEDATGMIDLHFGGPLGLNRGFILHTGDYVGVHSRAITGSIYFTTDVEILRAKASGKGPKGVFFALGYAGWTSGQLEREMDRGDWMVAPANEKAIFGGGEDDLWERISGSAGLPL